MDNLGKEIKDKYIRIENIKFGSEAKGIIKQPSSKDMDLFEMSTHFPKFLLRFCHHTLHRYEGTLSCGNKKLKKFNLNQNRLNYLILISDEIYFN